MNLMGARGRSGSIFSNGRLVSGHPIKWVPSCPRVARKPVSDPVLLLRRGALPLYSYHRLLDTPPRSRARLYLQQPAPAAHIRQLLANRTSGFRLPSLARSDIPTLPHTHTHAALRSLPSLLLLSLAGHVECARTVVPALPGRKMCSRAARTRARAPGARRAFRVVSA